MLVILLKRKWGLKLIKGSMLCILLCACSGCTRTKGVIRAEGTFDYHVNGVIVSTPSREPTADANIIVVLWRPDPNKISSARFHYFRTENDGAFSGTYTTGLAWGVDLICGTTPSAPVPPKLRNIFIGVQLPDEQWYIHEVIVTANMQKKTAPAERWIEIGTIAIPAAKHEDDT